MRRYCAGCRKMTASRPRVHRLRSLEPEIPLPVAADCHRGSKNAVYLLISHIAGFSEQDWAADFRDPIVLLGADLA